MRSKTGVSRAQSHRTENGFGAAAAVDVIAEQYYSKGLISVLGSTSNLWVPLQLTWPSTLLLGNTMLVKV